MNKGALKFSIICPVYNSQAFLKDCIESVLKQTLSPSEIVLVIDGQIGFELESVIRDVQNKTSIIRIIRFSENRGHGEARRESIKACTNSLVAIMDSDDISVPNRCQMQIDYFNTHNVDIVGGMIEEFVDDNGIKSIGKRTVPVEHQDIVKFAKKRCPMNQVTVMFKKDKYDEAGGYIDWYCEEDYYLWLRMISSGSIFANIPETLVYVRTDENYYQRRSGKRYYESEKSLQKYMLSNKFIGKFRYIVNCTERFILQIEYLRYANNLAISYVNG